MNAAFLSQQSEELRKQQEQIQMLQDQIRQQQEQILKAEAQLKNTSGGLQSGEPGLELPSQTNRGFVQPNTAINMGGMNQGLQGNLNNVNNATSQGMATATGGANFQPLSQSFLGNSPQGVKRPLNQDTLAEAPGKKSRIFVNREVSWDWDSSVEVTLVIPAESLGLVIGKGGAGLRELGQSTGGQVVLPAAGGGWGPKAPAAGAPEGPGEKSVNLRGSWQQVKEMQCMILKRMADMLYSQKDGAEESETSEKIEWYIPSGKVGLLLGTRGTTIKDLQAKTKAKVQVATDKLAALTHPAPETLVTLTGTPEAVEAARAKVAALVGGRAAAAAAADGGAGQPPPGTVARDVHVPYRSVGHLLGPKGETMRRLCEATGARVRVGPAAALRSGCAEHTVTVSGAPEAVARAAQRLREAVAEWRRGKGAPAPGWKPEDPLTHPSLVKLAFPQSLGSFIIGRGGSGVKEVEADSGATVKVLNGTTAVAPHAPGREDVPIIFAGTLGAILTAQALMLKRICESPLRAQAVQFSNPPPPAAADAADGPGAAAAAAPGAPLGLPAPAPAGPAGPGGAAASLLMAGAAALIQRAAGLGQQRMMGGLQKAYEGMAHQSVGAQGAGGQQQSMGLQGMGGQQGVAGGQQGMGRQQGMVSQQGMGGQQGMASKQGMGGQQGMESQQGMASKQGMGGQQAMGSQQTMGVQQGIGSQQGIGQRGMAIQQGIGSQGIGQQGMGSQQGTGIQQGVGQQGLGSQQGIGNQQRMGIQQGLGQFGMGSQQAMVQPMLAGLTGQNAAGQQGMDLNGPNQQVMALIRQQQIIGMNQRGLGSQQPMWPVTGGQLVPGQQNMRIQQVIQLKQLQGMIQQGQQQAFQSGQGGKKWP